MSEQEVSSPARLTRKQRRAMGITIRNIKSKLKEMQESGELDGVDKSEYGPLVMTRLLQDNPKAFGDASQVGIDMDGILAFIEMLLPLILMLMKLFG